MLCVESGKLMSQIQDDSVLDILVMSVEELLKHYAAGERDFSEIDLMGKSLIAINLSGANLYRAKLYETNLSGASLNGVNLHGAALSRSDLSNADLTNTDLTNADLSEACLSNTRFSGCKFHGTDLMNATWSGDLINVDFSGAKHFFFGLGLQEVTFCNVTLPNGRVVNGTIEK